MTQNQQEESKKNMPYVFSPGLMIHEAGCKVLEELINGREAHVTIDMNDQKGNKYTIHVRSELVQ